MKKLMLLALALAPDMAGAETTGPLSTYLVDPCRLLDTREQPQGHESGVFVGQEFRLYVVQESCDVPLGAEGVLLNVTVTGATKDGHLGIWRPGFEALPKTSALNFSRGQTLANGITVRLGKVDPGRLMADLMIFSNTPGGRAHVIVDVVGFLR